MIKRSLTVDGAADNNVKRAKEEEEYDDDSVAATRAAAVFLDDNVLYEVMKHVDARSLAVAGCVSKQWNKAARDERLWEMICTKQWPNTGCGQEQLRSVILSLGGFRRLYPLCVWPLSKRHVSSTSSSSSSSSSYWPVVPKVIPSSNPRLGKDEVHLSLSLLSIRYYEKMNFNHKNR
ncbi:F-box protein GID2-like [Lotus japonicus]|uniref:F-box protein GID2-like n=1 Tax=Lotus japonicus TaxID=34305 RepID=UPI002587F5ED|nr:F-box protein GID2-like [Lotus japonicus]